MSLEDVTSSRDENLLRHVDAQHDSIEERLEELEAQLTRECSHDIVMISRDYLCFVT